MLARQRRRWCFNDCLRDPQFLALLIGGGGSPMLPIAMHWSTLHYTESLHVISFPCDLRRYPVFRLKLARVCTFNVLDSTKAGTWIQCYFERKLKIKAVMLLIYIPSDPTTPSYDIREDFKSIFSDHREYIVTLWRYCDETYQDSVSANIRHALHGSGPEMRYDDHMMRYII